MNPIRAIRRLARILAAALAVGLACAAAPAALATPRPLPPGWNKYPPLPAGPHPALRYPPGWNKHPPLLGHARTLASAGMPAWQITLIVITCILLATALAVTYRLRATRRRAAATPA